MPNSIANWGNLYDSPRDWPAQFSAFFAGQSLAEYPFIRGTPRVARNLAADLRVLFGYSTAGTITSYNTGKLFHDGSSQTAEDWTVRLDNLASGGSALLDISQSGSQIATSNYWWNTQDNTAATGNAKDVANSPGPLWRTLITAIEARVSAGKKPHMFVWSQGTTDMTADAAVLATYKTVNKALFDAVRAAVQASIPIFILRIGRHQTATDAGAENIRQVQREIAAEMAKVYFGAEEYPYRMAVAGSHASAGITNGSNVVTLANTSGLSVNDGIEGPGIPSGAYISAISANTSITLVRRVNGVAAAANATGSSTSTIYRIDNVHLYPGADGTQPLDTGGTAHNEADGFYAVFKTLGRRIARVFGVSSAIASQGPYITAATAVRGAVKVRVSIAHVGGTDLSGVGDTQGWRVTVDGVAQTITGVTKIDATTVDVTCSLPFYGDAITVQYAYGAMNFADYTKFITDNASPVAFPMQEIAATSALLPQATSFAGQIFGSVSVTPQDAQVNTGDLTTYTFNGVTDSDPYSLVFAIGMRSTLARTVANMTVGGVAPQKLGELVFGVGTPNLNRIDAYVMEFPAGGASGNIEITYSGAALRAGLGAAIVKGKSAAAFAHDFKTSISDPASVSLRVPNNGAAIAYAFSASAAPITHTWSSGLTEAFDSVVETNFTHSLATGLFAAGGNAALECDFLAAPTLGGGAVFIALPPA